MMLSVVFTAVNHSCCVILECDDLHFGM